MTHFASSQESTVRGRYSSPRTSGQSRLGPRKFGEDASERTAFHNIHPYSLLLHHHRYVDCAVGATCTASGGVSHAAQPVSLAHAQFDSATLFSSPGDLPSSTPFSRRRWQSGTPLSCARGLLSSWQRMQSSRSLQPRWGRVLQPFILPKKGGGLRPILDLWVLNRALHKLPFKMQAHFQMHPGLVCSDRPEGCLLSCFDPSATQTVPAVYVRRSGMAVRSPPLRALPVSPCVHEGRRRRPYPVTGSGRQDPQLPRRLAYPSPIQRAVGRSQGLGASAPQPVGASGQLGKEQALPCAENLFSRCGVRLVEYDGTPNGGTYPSNAELPEFSFRGRNLVPLKQFQRLLVHMASAAAVTPHRLLHMRPLQHWQYSRVLRWAWHSSILWMGITQQCRRSLSPWTDLAFLRARVPLEQVSRHTVVTTDASSTGWGATCNGQAALGLWTGPRLLWHINCLELWAAHLALQQFRPLLLGKHMLVRTDNTAAVSYINRLSPTISSSGVTRSSSHCALFTSRGSSIVQPTRSHDSSHSPESGDSIPRRSGSSGVDSGKLRWTCLLPPSPPTASCTFLFCWFCSIGPRGPGFPNSFPSRQHLSGAFLWGRTSSQRLGTIWHPCPDLWNLHVWLLDGTRQTWAVYHRQWQRPSFRLELLLHGKPTHWNGVCSRTSVLLTEKTPEKARLE